MDTNSSAHARSSSATTAEQRIQTDATAAEAHSSMFSRSAGLPAHMGKATEDCKTKLPFKVKSDLTELLHSLGMTESEWVRLQVMKGLYGAEQVQRMHLDHIRAAVGMGPLQAHKEGATP